MEWSERIVYIVAAVPVLLAFGFFDRFYLEPKRIQKQLDEKKRLEEIQLRKQKQKEEEELKRQQQEEEEKRQRKIQYKEAIWAWRLRMQRDGIPFTKRRSFEFGKIAESSDNIEKPTYQYPLYWRCDEILHAAAETVDVFTIRTFLEAGGDPNTKVCTQDFPSILENVFSVWVIGTSWANSYTTSCEQNQEDDENLDLVKPSKNTQVVIKAHSNVTDKECVLIAKLLLLCGATITENALTNAKQQRFGKDKVSLLKLLEEQFPIPEERTLVQEHDDRDEISPEFVSLFHKQTPNYQIKERKKILPPLLIPKNFADGLTTKTQVLSPPVDNLYLRPGELMSTAINFSDIKLTRKVLEAGLNPNTIVQSRDILFALEHLSSQFQEVSCSYNSTIAGKYHHRYIYPEDRLLVALLLLLAGAKITDQCFEIANYEDKYKKPSPTLIAFLGSWKKSEGEKEEERIKKQMDLIFPSTSRWTSDSLVEV